MRALILTLGTRGDLELLLHLARALIARGHEVTVTTSAFNAAAVEQAGAKLVRVGSDASHAGLVAAMRAAGRTNDLVARTRLFYEGWLRPQLAPALRALASLTSQHDIFINNLKIVLRRGASVLPGVSLTYDPPHSVEDLPRYGPPRREVLDLVALPRELVDPLSRWEPRFRFTGFWTSPPGFDPPRLAPHLERFLDAGPPPITVALGSMTFADPQEHATLLLRALRLSGHRAVIVRGWADWQITPGQNKDVLIVDEAPYAALFPRSSAVIHHGGVGTLAAVLRAGKPSIILPQVACQNVLGQILLRERLAAGVLEPESLSAEMLAASIAAATTDTEFSARSTAWRQQLWQEAGAAQAANWIETHLEELAS